ncbi:MAG TPA: hypothetical protein VIJ94_18045 [Caulobacteraceae bacterium]
MSIRRIAAVLAVGVWVIAGPAFADDLLLSKGDATDLIASNVGKPYWQMEAQCAGMFGAAYSFDVDRHKPAEADRAKASGISMLNEAIGRLQADRGIDQPAALNLAAQEVEVGRAGAKTALERQGAGPGSYYNWMRSACFDISDAQRRHTAQR